MSDADDTDEPIYVTIGQVAPILRMTRDTLRAELARRGVTPSAGTRAVPLYRLRDIIDALFDRETTLVRRRD